MDAPAAIRAVYTDYRRVKGRKVHQITLEIPSELWPQAYAFLGEPSIETTEWYALAKLVQDAQPQAPAPEPKEKRTITQLHGGSQAALTCKREAFWRFLRDHRNYDCYSEEEAAHFVRKFCQVSSRSEIETDPKARNRWHLLHSAFSAWLAEPVA